MYVKDLPFFTKFLVTLYADDTYLMLSDQHLDSKVNAKLAKINYWMQANKLSLIITLQLTIC